MKNKVLNTDEGYFIYNILQSKIKYFLARSAKVAERAICFTDRNFLLLFFIHLF